MIYCHFSLFEIFIFSKFSYSHNINVAVSNLCDEALVTGYDSWKVQQLKKNVVDGSQTREFYFCDYSFLFSAEAKKRLVSVKARLHQLYAQHLAIQSVGFTGKIRSEKQTGGEQES